MHRVSVLSMLAVCGLLAACAQPIHSDRVDWDHGARYGRVLEVLAPQAAEAEARACLGADRPLPAGLRFVRVRYRRTRLHHKVVATVADGLDLRAGDAVELWPEDCGQGRLARVGRVLAPLAGQS
jgi:hypothetical protein